MLSFAKLDPYAGNEVKVAVVGAGICGSSAARYVAIKGHDVALFEQFGLGHDLGSSHGNSRIVRKAYPDAYYTECMTRAYPLWSELERHADRRLLHEVGLMYFGDELATDLLSMTMGLTDVGVPFEILDPAQSAKALPGLILDKGEIGVFTADAGWVDAKAAIEANIQVLRSLGGIILTDHPVDWERLEQDFDAFVVCAPDPGCANSSMFLSEPPSKRSVMLDCASSWRDQCGSRRVHLACTASQLNRTVWT